MANTLFKTLKSCCLQGMRQRNQSLRFDSTYKAAVINNNVKDLSIEPKKRSKLKHDEVRVQVHYCSVNTNDVPSFHDGSKMLPFTPGYELSGQVIELGKKVTNEQITMGERVAALSLENLGGFAEECVLNVNDIFRLPTNVELKSAAVLTSGHATAFWAFSKFYQLKEKEVVLITAAEAGLGLAAVDVAANVFGANVIGVVDSDNRAQLLRERGAFKTINFDSKLHKHVLSETNNKGVRLIYDAVGSNMFDSVGKCVATGGTIFHLAPCKADTIPKPPVNTYLMLLSLLELRKNNIEEYRSVINDTLELADQGLIEPYIGAKFDFTKINEAINFIEENKATGKVLIKVIS